MADEISKDKRTVFEQIKETDENGNEFWGARKLFKLLEYGEFRSFAPVVDRAVEACANSGQPVADHFGKYTEMVPIGSGAQREMASIKLSRYACYLIVQNADPAKEIVAQGQTYFAMQTRLQEIRQMDEYQRLETEEAKRLFLRKEMTEHNKQLAEAAKGAGVCDPKDYAIFQNHGYKGLYGGLDAKGIHSRKRLKKREGILDHMGSTELAANLFRATQTEEKLKREKVRNKFEANKTHYEVGTEVRETIKKIGGTMPEDLPVAGSIKKIGKATEPKGLEPKK